MIKYVSNKGGGTPVDFETAILMGKPSDGGLFVPTALPTISLDQLKSWKNLSYTDLAFEILSLFIDHSAIPSEDLKILIEDSFKPFYHADKIPFRTLSSRNNVIVQELFHGPTLSFKDVAMGFVVNLFDYFLKRRGEKMTIVVATSGDTGPAAAYATIGKKTLNVWTLYPEGYVTEEQERQMTTISAPNVHAVRVSNCPNGSDDLDELIADLFVDDVLKKKLNLSSVNSINWGRVMMQTVHYFYGYLQNIDRVGEPMNFAVPTGAFGNLCAGTLAREIGLPIGKFVISNNSNNCLVRIFSEGIYQKKAVVNCASSAIDISTPINFWRYLYFAIDGKSEKIKQWMTDAESGKKVVFDLETLEQFKEGFLSASISDETTINTIKNVFVAEGYLLDPHAAVAVAATQKLKSELKDATKTLCLATAHPSKFPATIKQSLDTKDLPSQATHESIEKVKANCQRVYECNHETAYKAVSATMLSFVK